jgi:hypothetical protein
MEEEEQQVEYQSPDDTVSPNDEGNNQQAVDENIDGSELSPALADGEGIQEISTSRPISETAETSTSTEEAGEQNNDGQAQPQGEQQPTDSGEQPQKKSSDAKPATDAPSEPPKKPKLEIKGLYSLCIKPNH